MSVEAHVVTSLGELIDLAPEWQALLTRCQGTSIFLAPVWHVAWWRAFGSGRVPYVVTFRDGARLVAVMPLMRRRDTLRGLPVRVTGSYNDGHTSRTGMVVEPGYEPAVAAALAARLAKCDADWDVVMLRQLPRDADWLVSFIAACDDVGLVAFAPVAGVSKFVIPLTGTWPDYLAGKGRHFRNRLRENMRRVQRAGGAAYRRSDGAAEDFEVFASLERGSWKHLDGQARLGPVGWAFQREIALAADSGVSCYNLFLELDGRVVGGVHAVGYDGVAYSLQMLFHESVRHLYPGRAQFAVHVADMFGSGRYRLLDLNGDSAFCRSWADTEMEFVGLQVYNRRPYSSLLSRIKRLVGRNR